MRKKHYVKNGYCHPYLHSNADQLCAMRACIRLFSLLTGQGIFSNFINIGAKHALKGKLSSSTQAKPLQESYPDNALNKLRAKALQISNSILAAGRQMPAVDTSFLPKSPPGFIVPMIRKS